MSITTTGPTSVRARQVALIVRPVARSISWGPFAVSVLLAALLVANQARRGWSDAGAMAASLRTAMFVLAGSAGFAIEDPAAATIAGVPLPLAVRRTLRIILYGAVVAAGWAALVLVATARTTGVPVAWLTLELAGTFSLALAVAATLIHTGRVSAGQQAVPAVLVFWLVAQRLPARWTLLGGEPGTSRWIDAHRHWFLLLCVLVAIIAALSRDPARREPLARFRATRT